jgi:adenosylcobinamide kinase/adenosylcobinamide-phosphate guanylyltransferase
MVSLVIGGACSGNSRFAQSLGASSQRAFYIATARPADAAPIEEYRRQRPAHWCRIEAPLEIAAVVDTAVNANFLLLDCLTVWLSNFCWEHRKKPERDIETTALTEVARVAATATEAHVVLVNKEVGCTLMPDTPLGRFFRDLQGRINQEATPVADQVFFVVAGIPMAIKQPEKRS